MFLFTTPTAPTPAPPPSGAAGTVVDAIKQGAQASGADFDYLLRTAKRESSLDPSAKAPTSSATGLFQFIEQTWLGVVKSDGDKLGLAAQSQAVTTRPDGTLTVADPSAREAILKLREEPGVAAAMAGALTRQNRDALQAAVGRAPTDGELYMAHVLGARGAAGLIATAQSDPSRPAASDFPDAARANRGIFYERGGRPRGAAEVYAVLASAQTGQTGSSKPAAPAPAADPVGYHPPGLQGLFQTGSRAGPLSDAVARIWQSNATSRAPDDRKVAFFPRSNPTSATDPVADVDASGGPGAEPDSPQAASAPSEQGLPRAASVPLPPIRPNFASASVSGTQTVGSGSRRTASSRP